MCSASVDVPLGGRPTTAQMQRWRREDPKAAPRAVAAAASGGCRRA
jgi:hypothetical protein